jgi:hypothetical protein
VANELLAQAKETLTFEADLDGSPSFHLEVVRHRWCAHNRGISSRKRDDAEWDVYEPGPVILTTRTHWKQDPSAELNALMSARRQDFLEVHFRPESPQFSATVHLEVSGRPRSGHGICQRPARDRRGSFDPPPVSGSPDRFVARLIS